MIAAPDWSQFHASLMLLKARGTLESQLCAVDSQLRVRMRKQLGQFFGETSGSFSSRSRRTKLQDEPSTALADLADPAKLVAVVSKAWLRDEDSSRQSRLHQFEMELRDRSQTRQDLILLTYVATRLQRCVLFMCIGVKAKGDLLSC